MTAIGWDRKDGSESVYVSRSAEIYARLQLFESADSLCFFSLSKNFNIKCAWAIDCPNHGIFATLNEAALGHPFTTPVSQFQLHGKLTLVQSDAAKLFIDSCLLDYTSHRCFRSQRLVGMAIPLMESLC